MAVLNDQLNGTPRIYKDGAMVVTFTTGRNSYADSHRPSG
jgi:hypothetical protein